MLFFSFLDLLLHHLFQPYLLHIVQVIFFIILFAFAKEVMLCLWFVSNIIQEAMDGFENCFIFGSDLHTGQFKGFFAMRLFVTFLLVLC